MRAHRHANGNGPLLLNRVKGPAPAALTLGQGGAIEATRLLSVQETGSSPPKLRIVILGLSITSSWGNGHATTYRGLVRELSARGHDVLFLERDAEWYASNRDLPRPPFGRTELYSDLKDLKHRFAGDIRQADLVIVGSYVADGVAIGDWVTRKAQGVTAFYDIDTP